LALNDPAIEKLEVNLAEVSYLDSSAFGHVVDAARAGIE